MMEARMSEPVPNQEAEVARAPEARGHGAAVLVFHWLSALIVLVMIGTGWWMLELIHDPAHRAASFPFFQFHKSLGFLILAITALRIGWRLTHRPPSLPAGMPGWERLSALAAQAMFYVLLVAIPLSGWMYISTEWAESMDKQFKGETLFFGLFAVPYFAPIADAGEELRRTLSFHLSGAHRWMAYGLLALVALHSAAALKHHFVERDNVLAHMLPFLKRRPESPDDDAARRPGLGSLMIWSVAIAVVGAAALLGWIANDPPRRQGAASAYAGSGMHADAEALRRQLEH
jgi:cytochrome b561